MASYPKKNFSGPTAFFHFKPFRVNHHHRTSRRIEERIDTTLEPDGVGADVAACGGVVVAVPVVEQAGFGVVELPRHAQVDGGGAAGAAVTEGIRRPRPDLRPASIGTVFRRAEVVGVQIGYGFGAARIDLRQRRAVQVSTTSIKWLA